MADWWSSDKAADDNESWWEADKAEAESKADPRKDLPPGVTPSEAGAGRGGAEFAAGDPRLSGKDRAVWEQNRGELVGGKEIVGAVKGGVETVKGLAKGVQAFGAGVDWAGARDTLIDLDAVDAGKPPAATVSRTVGPDGRQRLGDANAVVRQYAAGTTDERQRLRQSLSTSLMRDENFIGEAAKALEQYKAQAYRDQGGRDIPQFTDIETAKGFYNWLTLNAAAGAPTMAASMVGAIFGPAGLAVTSGATAVGDLTQARVEAAAKRDGATPASIAGHLADNAANTVALAPIYAVGDALGPEMGAAMRAVSRVGPATVKGAIVDSAKRLPKEAGYEALGEGPVQEGVNIAGEMAAGERGTDLTMDDAKRVVNAAAAGAAAAPMGSGIGGVRDVVAVARENASLAAAADAGDVAAAVEIAMRRGELRSFTPADSEVARAGITPVVAPVTPGAAPQVDVKANRPPGEDPLSAGITPPVTPSAAQPTAPNEGDILPPASGMPDFTGAMAAVDARNGADVSGYPEATWTPERTADDLLPKAQRVKVVDDGSVAPLEGPDGRMYLPVIREDGSRAFARTDLLTDRQERAKPPEPADAAAAPPSTPDPTEPETAAPVATWTGRRGDGYVVAADAQQALEGRRRKQPDLDWRVDPRPDGKFVLNGYARSSTSETTDESTGRAGAGLDQAEAAGLGRSATQPGAAQPGAAGVGVQADAAGDAGAGGLVLPGASAAGSTVDGVGGGAGRLDLRGRDVQPGQLDAQVPGGSGAPRVDPGVVRADLNRLQDMRLRDGEVTKLEVVDDASAPAEVKAVAAVFGSPVTFIRDRNKKASYGAVVLDKNRIYINVAALDAALSLTIHEIIHTLPAGIRDALIERVMRYVTPEKKKAFLKKYPRYAKRLPEGQQNEELVAMFAQDDSKRPEFWQDLQDKLGDSDFGKLARHVLSKLNELINRIRDGDDTQFVTDVKAVRGLVTEALARASRGETYWADDLEVSGDGGVDVGEISMDEARFSESGRAEEVGGFATRTFKDGSMEVAGDAGEIRAAIPDNVTGRVTKTGVSFTTADAARVRSALEGSAVAYSRGGAVLDRLPTKADGTYLGAPPAYNTPAKIPTLRRILRQLTKEGEAGRFWYENSGRAVLRMVGGNVTEARKFVALLAIYSPQAKVDTNSTFALRAWSQYKAGHPISVKTKVMDRKAKAALDDVDAFWSGEKTGNFFFNLLREIDPSTEGKQGATIDMWMMRAGQYPKDAPTKTEHAFMENETNRIAAELGWEPQQVQAAIWVALKARMENPGVKKRTEAISAKRKWIRFDSNAKGKKVRVILDKQRHRDNWIKQAMEHDVTNSDTMKAKFDFEDGLRRHIGQVSWEARPGRASGVLPGVNDAPYAQQVEFQQAVQKALIGDDGGDMLAQYLGLLADGEDLLAPGAWQGEVSAGMQKQVVMSPGPKSATAVDELQAKLLNVYAATLGLLLRQDGLGWHRPFFSANKRDSNGLDIRFGRVISETEMRDLYQAIDKKMLADGKTGWQNDMALVSSQTGVRIINFGVISNEDLRGSFVAAIESSLPAGEVLTFASDGSMPMNDWSKDSNGQAYVERIRAEGRPDVLEWARDVLAPRVQAVFDEYSREYEWGDAGSIDFSESGPERRGDRGRRQEGRGLAPLEGAPRIDGATGPDPRLVEVAEDYAKSVGIKLVRQSSYVDVDITRAKRLAAAYDAMPHAPRDPRVAAAYRDLIRQTRDQYQALADAGFQFWFYDETNDPYQGNPWNAMRDLRASQRMGVFATAAGFGSGATDLNVDDNPLLADTGVRWGWGSPDGRRKPVLANDLFRAVHDAFGHGLEGAGFRARGEENAWQAHARLFTGPALAALTSETRGQNSWLNYDPHGAKNQTARVEDTVFADQKTGLMPAWTWEEGVQFSEGAQPDLFPGEFASKRTTAKTSRLISSDGKTEVGGNVDSVGNRITATKQGLANFWRWFGYSEVTDDSGRPLVLYHSTNADVSVLRSGLKTTNNYGLLGDVEVSRAGIFMTPDRKFSQEYLREGSGQNVMPVYAKIENPLDLRGGLSEADERTLEAAGVSIRYVTNIQNYWELFDNADDGSNDFVDGMRKAGYDGAIFKEDSPTGDGGGGTTYVALESAQIKSATGNNGTFDANNPDIRFSETPWYSALTRAIEKGPAQAPAEQWRAFLKGLPAKGVKPDEIEWSGIEDWLRLQTGKVPRQAVVDFLDANGVRVEEVVLQGMPQFNGTGFDADRQSWVVYDSQGLVAADNFESEADAADWLEQNGADYVPAKYGKYTLPGGTNYREVLLTLPQKAATVDTAGWTVKLKRAVSPVTRKPEYEVFNAAGESQGTSYSETTEEAAIRNVARTLAQRGTERANYKSGHWDQPNVLAHIRVNDRTDATGARVLFVEEIQSDWGQAGKKQGFAGDIKRALLKNQTRLAEIDKRMADPAGYTPEEGNALLREQRDLTAEYGRLESQRLRATVPNAPFVTHTDKWLALALKRIVKMAVDEGYDRVAFVNGEQSAERYSLAKHIRTLKVKPLRGGGMYAVGSVLHGGESRAITTGEGVPAENLPDLVGKEMAERILADKLTPGEWHDYSDLDLKVGGEGMKAFYDVIVPNAVKGLLKKVGGGGLGAVQIVSQGRRVNAEGRWFTVDGIDDEGNPRIFETRQAAEYAAKASTATSQPGFDITDAMREAAAGGMPLFSENADYDGAFTRVSAGVGSADDRAVVQSRRGYGNVYKSPLAGDMESARALQGELEGLFPEQLYTDPHVDFQRGSIAAGLKRVAMAPGQKLQRLAELSDQYRAPITLRGTFAMDDSAVVGRLRQYGFVPHTGMLEAGGRQMGLDVTISMVRPAGGLTENTPLFSDYENEKARFGRQFLPNAVPPKKMRASDLKVGSVKSDKAVAVLTRTVDSEYPIINAARAAGDAVGRAWREAVEALPGKTADHVEQSRRQFIVPLTEAIGRAAKTLKIDPAQLVDAYGIYRTAMHAAERNDTLRANGSKKANPSGMSESEASQWQSFFRGEPGLLQALQSFDPMLKAIQEETDRVKLAAGLLTQDDIDARSGWDWYISLRGDPGADDVGGSRGQGSWNNDIDPRARGRDSLSANPIVNTVKMLENGIRLAEMAAVKKATYEFAVAHPDLIKAKVVRLVNRPLFDENGNFAKAVPNRDKFATEAVVYRQGDVEFHIEIGDGKVAEALKRMERDDMGVALRALGKFTSTLGRLWTQFSPHFPPVNFIRDLQQQLAYIAGSDIKIGGKSISSFRAAWMIASRYPRTFGAAVSEVMGRAPSGKYTRYARELAAAGGMSGFTKMLSDDDALKDFVQEVKWKAGKAKSSLAWNKFVDAVAGVSEVFEMTTRAAAYSVMRDMGMPSSQAANFTKNLMNFSKSGTETRKLGNLYMFLKPAVQDVYLTSKLLRTRKGQIVFAGMYVGALALYAMMRELSGDDDEDPRLKKMDTRTASERRSYYILPVGGEEPVRIPVGFGLPRMAWGLAVTTVDLMNNPDYDAWDAADNALKSMTSTLSPLQLSDINMFKNPAEFLATTFMPTIAVPVIEFGQNKTKGGSTIYKNNGFYSSPDYTKGFSSTPKEWKDAVQWMYDNSNGKIDISPESLPFVLRSYGGGPATMLVNALNTREKMRQDEPLGRRDIPVVQAFTGPRDRYPERRFRDLSQSADEAVAKIKDSEIRGGRLAAKIMSDKEQALKASLKKSVDRIERMEAKALADIREIQLDDYDAGARELKKMERAMRREKQSVLDGYNSGRPRDE